ncbi:MAG: hypothetical protein GTN62_06545 [Gemmatimonadales bacterium]|nr:hypothetical protein [Gemmatimonadales bacterium]NIN11156.1 hypothetical protein [Gemmatimonadales bacterium]NIN49755.1 hypothetical protein [Gemmatimonadales bacterium]NIP07219.1 hypothetical protein [Gemmatimonadales bacterium]NIR00432.1 hypothetical protein [Gemmatimonadales bacterium]
MILPRPQDRGIVVFLLFPSMPYGPRLVTSFGLIAAGVLVQLYAGSFLPGCGLLIAGNLLLLVKGYDNRVDVKAFDPDPHWERAGMEKLEELKVLDQKIRRWDRSALDVSNPLGLVVFVLVAGGLGFMAWNTTGHARTLGLDGIVLLVPHWITGVRSTLRRPNLLVRIETIEAVLDRARRRLRDHNVTLMMLLSGGDTKIPEDVKFRVDIANHDQDFLGLYGQVVINEVQGTSHPYFYVVLVARRGYGLREVFRRYANPSNLTKEFKREGEVEVMVIRQHTTKTKGYATKPAVANDIFHQGLKLAEQVAVKAAA